MLPGIHNVVDRGEQVLVLVVVGRRTGTGSATADTAAAVSNVIDADNNNGGARRIDALSGTTMADDRHRQLSDATLSGSYCVAPGPGAPGYEPGHKHIQRIWLVFGCFAADRFIIAS